MLNLFIIGREKRSPTAGGFDREISLTRYACGRGLQTLVCAISRSQHLGEATCTVGGFRWPCTTLI